MNYRRFAWALLTIALIWNGAATAKDPVDRVDPLIGTGRQGKTFPGATTPGGMVQLSPDTITGGDNGSGYRYRDHTIAGFSVNHMSGVGWYGDLGNFLITPTTGPLKTGCGQTDQPGSGYQSAYSHDSELARAGYYAVTLGDSHIRTELTAAAHSGMLRFTFPANPQSRIQIDLARRVGGTSLHQIVRATDDHTIEGQIDCTPAGGGWGHGAGKVNYTLYFHAEFSKPFEHVGTWSADLSADRNYTDAIDKPWFIDACAHAKVTPDQREAEGKHIGFYSEFATQANDVVLMKVGISYVSIAGARANLAAEIKGFDFDGVAAAAKQRWSETLARVSVSGNTDEAQAAFYTALYHALLDPRMLTDVDGQFPGGDGEPHIAKDYTHRTIFSGWDVYRSAFPLYTLIAPQVVSDMIHSMIDLAGENHSGYFDRWELLNAYSGCMNGSPMVVVVNDAWQKGIRDFDGTKALTLADATCQRVAKSEATSPYALSCEMEDRNAEWNCGQLAAAMGQTDLAKKYADSAMRYRTLFDPSVPWTYTPKNITPPNPQWNGWFRALNADGTGPPWLGLESEKTVQEASVYQQGWFVPYDVPGLIDLLGGKEAFIAKLSDFFDRTPDVGKWNPFYNHPNEPVHLIPFLFNRAGAPWLTQKWVRTIDAAYRTGPDGLCGDEDVGQMSSWFVLAAVGIHPACPGDPRYEVFTPLFDRVEIRLDPHYAKGKTFVITAQNNSPANIYIQSAMLNDQPLNRCWLTYEEITAGGSLNLVLGPTPNQQWGLASR